ncbi:MAG: AIM24 family protein, partial [Armatimonadota bacterium]|nr:AIM24 family protein [Armatimonadota bacterium]
GLLVLHGYGNVFERRLAAGESILVEPGAFLYKDASVTMQVESQKLKTGLFGGAGLNLAKMTGPGRLGIQSMYMHHHTD